MNEAPNDSRKQDRKSREAAALRENLRRRKALIRAKSSAENEIKTNQISDKTWSGE
jgi:hypothetical protein